MVDLYKEDNSYVVRVTTVVNGQTEIEFSFFKNKKKADKEYTKQRRKHAIRS